MSAARFTLEIELGNAAMQTGEDVAEALDRLGSVLGDMTEPSQQGAGRIRDLNGNTVGHWALER